FSENLFVAHLRLPYVNISMFQCQLSFLFRLPRFALLLSATRIILHLHIKIVNAFYIKIKYFYSSYENSRHLSPLNFEVRGVLVYHLQEMLNTSEVDTAA
ncbi:hypothetical protein V7183_24615, partial [Bacillus sp. JJ1127]|uniref:hypothetical protein n=1 Tax=Bacillus sp. JJ1127 TaxID=3122952 RepID=UPI002FFF5C14